MKNLIYLIVLCLAFISCDNYDNPNLHLYSQFSTEVIDSSAILSPKTHSYLKNLEPPIGVKPIIKVVDKIDEENIACYADDLFDMYCEERNSSTFKQRGVLIVASKTPELIQVRIGKIYSLYCRMHGSAAGEGYLKMQQQTKEEGIEAVCPIAINNIFKDIEECKQLPWHKKLFLKLSFANVDNIMCDLATPSENFFNQIYFHPFLYIIGLVKKVLHSWVLSFIVIISLYIFIRNTIKKRLQEYLNKKALEKSRNELEYVKRMEAYEAIRIFISWLITLFIAIPTFSSISLLSSSRMEDILTLQYYNIATIDILASTTHWSNSNTSIVLVFLLMIAYYLKEVLTAKNILILASIPNSYQQKIAANENEKYLLDKIIKIGNQKRFISKIFSGFFNIVHSSFVYKNFQETDFFTNEIDNGEQEDTDGRKKEKAKLIDFFFINSEDNIFHQSPYLAVAINYHREALFMTFIIAIIATTLLSSTYTLYFIILWISQICFDLYGLNKIARTNFKQIIPRIKPKRLISETWKTLLIFFALTLTLCWAITPDFKPQSFAPIDVSSALPEDISGTYFAERIEGAKAKGATARIVKDENGYYHMQVYSESPVQRFKLTYDNETGLLDNEVLGKGYIYFKKETGTLTINFSDLWILTK